MTESCPDFSTCTVLVAGDVMLDVYHWGEVRRISPEAPVPVVKITQKSQTLGGAGNVALNLAGLGCQVYLLGIRGDDSSGTAVANILTDKGLGDKVTITPNYSTTTKTRIMGQGQQLLRLDEEVRWPSGSKTGEKLIADFKKLLPSVDVVILSDYAKGLLTGGLAETFINSCTAAGVPVFIDPKEGDWSRYSRATCLTPNDREFARMVGETSGDATTIEQQAQELISRLDLNYLLLTRGSEGMSLFSREGAPVHIPAEAREVFDVSGAGDTVISVAAAALASGLDITSATRLANCAAGVVVEKVGTRPISLVELEAALKKRQGTPAGKLLDVDDARTMIKLWKNDGHKVVFTNGCFDLLHTGHIKLLQAAAREGDKLVIGLNADASIKRLKGALRPVLPEKERAALLSAIGDVDLVVLFAEDTPLDLINKFHPDILVKGGDYTPETVVGRDIVESYGGRVVLVPLKDGISTTDIINSVQARED